MSATAVLTAILEAGYLGGEVYKLAKRALDGNDVTELEIEQAFLDGVQFSKELQDAIDEEIGGGVS